MKSRFALVSYLLPFILAFAAETMAQTPILDRNLFFGNPLISGGQLSPDGKTISFLKAYNGIMNVWVKDFNEPFEKARPLTDSKRPLYGYFWTEDGRYVLYVKDKDGDENINVFAVDPLSATPAGQEVPESRNLTPLNEVTAQIYHVSKEQPDLLWVGLNDRDKAWHDLYQVQLSTGERTLLYKNEDRITGYMFDWDDKLRLLSRTDEKGNTTLLRKDGEKLVAIYETSVTEGASVPGWEKGNKRFYLETNKGELNLSTLFLMDPLTKEMTLLESDPENRVDFGSLRLDENTHEVICTSYEDDRVRHYWKNKTWEANYNFLKSKFLGREVSFQSSTRDYSKFLVGITGDRYAAESWFFDAKSRELIHQYTPRPELKEVEAHLAPMEAVRYPSSDGLEIPAYLTIPVGVEAKQLPLVVLVHGGPKGPRDNWGYDPEAQFLANRGYAVLQPNFRASGGYGKAFLNAGDLQWGKLMQDDITWGVKHLVDRGIADKHRVAIMGGSYGGYATLAGLAFTPDLYACGVDIVGPSNILTLLNSIPAYWEAGRAFLYGMVGDPQTDAGRELIHNASPLFRAEQIKKPLLIIQGANDPRVKQAEADQIVIALRDRGHDVSYLLAGDEGHGFAKPINRMAMYAEVERFLASKLGGRYQESMPEEVAKRLAELRVDVTKVTYTKPEALAIAKALPELKVQVDEGTETWQVKLAVQGQQLPMTIERTRLRRDGNWLITDVTSGPLGKMVNSATYSANWQSLSRSIEQGGQTIEGVHQPGKVMVKMGEQVSELTYEGALLCDGPGRDYIVAGMPLEKGFEIGVMMPDFASNKVSSYRLKCEGTASIEGRECLKVVIANVENTAERTVIWFDAKSRSPLQIEQVIPALQNATLTMKRGG